MGELKYLDHSREYLDDMFTELHEKVQRGKITSALVVYIDEDGTVTYDSGGGVTDHDILTMIGMLNHNIRRLDDMFNEDAEEL